MSRLISTENLSTYILQLNSIVRSLLCNHTSIKCVDLQFFSCSIRLIEELCLQHPYHSVVMQALQVFHQKYEGCSCKSLLFFLTTLYHQFERNKQGFQKKIFNYLEEFIHQSKLIAEKEFSEILTIDSNLFSRICRYQTIYSDCLDQAYRYFITLKSDISHSELLIRFTDLVHITQVKYSEEKCLFIPGTILSTNQSINGSRRTILIDGYLLEDYVHLGYNNKIKLQQISSRSSWIYLISSILNEYSIEVILCSGTIDHKLKDLNNKQRVFIENIPSKTLRFIGESCLLNYLTDLNEENILLLNYKQTNLDSSLTIIDKGSTILQYVPLESLIDMKHEQFVHCLGRFRQILKKNFYLNGSGEFEKRIYQYWYNKQEYDSLEYHLAYDCFLECLQSFIREISSRKECFETDLIDDFDSKFDAWKTSIDLLKTLMQIDSVVQIVNDEELSEI